jgi:hypothetical protein
MEALTRLVADSLARHGLDRPVDPRRLQWSRWFRCDSPHSLLVIPSKPGIFALAEEVGVDVARASSPATSTQSEVWDGGQVSDAGKVGDGGKACDAGEVRDAERVSDGRLLGGAALQRCNQQPLMNAALAAEVKPARRMLAVLQFSEDDDMAFTLDRMFTRINPMRSRLASGRCFLRFVVIEDQAQRRAICSALNQWMLSSAEKATGISSDFASSLELNVARAPSPAFADSSWDRVGRTLPSASSQALSDSHGSPPISAGAAHPGRSRDSMQAPYLDSGATKNLHCPHSLPAGF